jgi:hypothetical protein
LKDLKASSEPAMATSLEQRLWDIGDIVTLIEEWEAAQ